MKNPSVVCNIKYYPYTDASETNAFYRCGTKRNIISYLSRDFANENLSPDDRAIVKALEELSNAPEHDIIDYAKNRRGSGGLFDATGTLSDDDAAKLKSKMAATKATIYSAVISFSSEFGPRFLTSNEEGREIINENLHVLFQSSQLDVDNMCWFGAVHTNTEHHHIHLLFWENEPSCLDKNGTPRFSKKNVLPEKNIELFKASILRMIKDNKIDYYSLRDEIRTGASSALKSDYLTLSYYAAQCEDIIGAGNFQYARLDKAQQRKVDKIVKQIIASDKNLSSKYSEYKSLLRNTHLDYIRLLKENGSRIIPDNIASFYSSRIKDLNSRLANEFLKTLKSYSMESRVRYEALSLNNPDKIGTPAYMPAKKKYTRQTAPIATTLLAEYIKLAEADVSAHHQSLEAFKREKELKGETVIFELND